MPDNLTGGGNVPITSGNATKSDSSATPSQTDRAYFDPERHVEKSEFTRMRQEDAKARAEAERRVQEREHLLQQREQQIMQAAQMLKQRLDQSQGGQTRNDRFADIRNMEYIDGQTAAKLMEKILGEDVGSIRRDLSDRDKALQLMWSRMQQQQKLLDQFQGRNMETEFEGRLGKVRESLGLPNEEWANEWLNDVYRSHEGDDLAEAFPDMARTRIEKLRKAFRALDKAEAEKARSMSIPGKGGEGVPARKLDELQGKSARDRASVIFDTMIKGGGEDF